MTTKTSSVEHVGQPPGPLGDLPPCQPPIADHEREPIGMTIGDGLVDGPHAPLHGSEGIGGPSRRGNRRELASYTEPLELVGLAASGTMSCATALVTYHRRVLTEDEVERLVSDAASGVQGAWDHLVEGFSGLVWSVIRAHGIYGAEGADIFQTVWLRFVEHIDRLNHPGRPGAWLATTARHECYRVTRRGARSIPTADVPEVAAPDGADVLVDTLQRAEQRDAVLAALNVLPPRCQELLRLLAAEPPLSYDEVADVLEIPKGSIGPTRGRCLERLRRVLAEG